VSTIASAIFAKLRSDAAFLALLPGGITSSWASNPTALPRLVFSIDYSNANTAIITGGTLTLFFSARSNDQEKLNQLRRMADKLIDGTIIDSAESGNTLRLFRQGQSMVNGPDPLITQLTCTYSLRAYRKEQFDPQDQVTES
jgi:hypothetical protein